MKIPVIRHYYSLVTEKVDSMCQAKTAGRDGGVYVLVILGGWTTLQTKQGGSLRPGPWGGIDAPGLSVPKKYHR